VTGTDSPVTPADTRLRQFDAAAQARREAEEQKIARQREAVVDLLDREAASAMQRREERRRAEEHAAKRPERWAALPQISKALHRAASERPFNVVAALVRIADLMAAPDHNDLRQPPRTFEE
jgi:hypothetical protein